MSVCPFSLLRVVVSPQIDKRARRLYMHALSARRSLP